MPLFFTLTGAPFQYTWRSVYGFDGFTLSFEDILASGFFNTKRKYTATANALPIVARIVLGGPELRVDAISARNYSAQPHRAVLRVADYDRIIILAFMAERAITKDPEPPQPQPLPAPEPKPAPSPPPAPTPTPET